ncbi:MAG: hypothetical protein PHP42_12590 [Bacteroidota bacterium]|nr:hypothetical protein [Bacteroidota bacterium]
MKSYSTLMYGILLVMATLLFGCSHSTSSGGAAGTSGSVDAALVGVWFTASDSTGTEIKSDGTFIPLTLDGASHLIAASVGGATFSISASGGNYTLTIKEPIQGTTRDTTITQKGTYTLNGNTLTTVATSGATGTTVYTKSSYGVNVFQGGGGTGTVDALLVGVWFTLSDTTGFDIKSTGVTDPLTVDGTGKIIVDTRYATAGISFKVQTASNSLTLSFTGKSRFTGNDTTVSQTGTYALTNANATLTLTLGGVTTVYFKTTLGANAFGGGGGGTGPGTFNFSVGGINHVGSIVAPSLNSGTFSATSVDNGISCSITVQATVGSKTIGTTSATLAASLVDGSYTGTSGTINVTSVTATNIKGTINAVITKSGGSTTQALTGSFDINF